MAGRPEITVCRWDPGGTVRGRNEYINFVRMTPKPSDAQEMLGANYVNYKGFQSNIILTLADGAYKFMWVDLGTNEANADSTIINNSNLVNILQPKKKARYPIVITYCGYSALPHFFLADVPLALQTWLMKPPSYVKYEHSRIPTYQQTDLRSSSCQE